jgi:hypothetical protein
MPPITIPTTEGEEEVLLLFPSLVGEITPGLEKELEEEEEEQE